MAENTAILTMDFRTTVTLAQAIVAEFGLGYKYELVNGMCVYFNEDDAPSCLVGQILARMGVEADTIHKLECNTSNIGALFDHGHLVADGPTRAFLSRLQSAQDDGSTWGDALIRALANTATDLHTTLDVIRRDATDALV